MTEKTVQYTLAGLDLAWVSERNPSALAIGELRSQGAQSGLVLHEIIDGLIGIDAIAQHLIQTPQLHGIAIDAPLIIPNASGARLGERELGKVYAGRHAACHPTNQSLYPDADSVALSQRLATQGFAHLAGPHQAWQIECYPHPALVEIFDLPTRLAYKKGSVDERRKGQQRFADLLRGLVESPVLALDFDNKDWPCLNSSHIAGLRGQALKQNEDQLDALVCLYIAALYQDQAPHQVFGDPEHGYVLVPQQMCAAPQH